MTPERESKFKEVVGHRQPDFTVILEDVHDPHNISAILRTCDSVGIMEIYVLYTKTEIQRLRLGKRSSGSARKWVDVHLFSNRESCFKAVKLKYDQIFATHLSDSSELVYQKDLSGSAAFLFGNEADGVSQESLNLCDGNIIIPQVGMTKSLNISVACAIILYESFRQRYLAGKYDQSSFSKDELSDLLVDYSNRKKSGLNFQNLNE